MISIHSKTVPTTAIKAPTKSSRARRQAAIYGTATAVSAVAAGLIALHAAICGFYLKETDFPPVGLMASCFATVSFAALTSHELKKIHYHLAKEAKKQPKKFTWSKEHILASEQNSDQAAEKHAQREELWSSARLHNQPLKQFYTGRQVAAKIKYITNITTPIEAHKKTKKQPQAFTWRSADILASYYDRLKNTPWGLVEEKV